MSATSASQRTDNSKAFLSSPFLLLEKVTCLLVAFSILFIWVFPLTIIIPKKINKIKRKKERNENGKAPENKMADLGCLWSETDWYQRLQTTRQDPLMVSKNRKG